MAETIRSTLNREHWASCPANHPVRLCMWDVTCEAAPWFRTQNHKVRIYFTAYLQDFVDRTTALAAKHGQAVHLHAVRNQFLQLVQNCLAI